MRRKRLRLSVQGETLGLNSITSVSYTHLDVYKRQLQGRVEYVLLDFASHALYSHLLSDGIEIYEYKKSFMHSKVAVVDGRWAMVGSSNIDPFSLMMSREANILVDDAAFTKELRDDLSEAIKKGASKVTQSNWLRQHYFKRLLSWLVYGLVRVMMGFAGYSERSAE